MELYIIRHAQSENNALWAETGTSDGRQPDPSITDIGHQQAQLLANFLVNGDPEGEPNSFAQRHNRGGFGLTHLYTSLMVRSIVTASYVAERTGLPLTGWLDIHERGGLHQTDPATGEEIGEAGPNRAFFADNHPALVLPPEIGEQGWWGQPPEDVESSYPRALRVWETLQHRHGGTDDHVAIISHGGFFQSLLMTLLGMDDTSVWKSAIAGQIWFGMSNTAISRVELTNGNGVVRYINRVDHLPSHLITG
jgi:2,3-bisphosphoglycerate-dependent phosphoglycerate mutase